MGDAPDSFLTARVEATSQLDKVDDDKCTDYMKTDGCGWTRTWWCPGEPWGGQTAKSPADEDGSVGFACCCTQEHWRDQPGDEDPKKKEAPAKPAEEEPKKAPKKAPKKRHQQRTRRKTRRRIKTMKKKKKKMKTRRKTRKRIKTMKKKKMKTRRKTR